MVSQEGLEWEDRLFYYVPKWTREPRIEDVERTARQALGEPSTLKINFFGQGAFKKLYKIRSDQGDFMMRVSLPVDPKLKTVSEVATLALVSRTTDLTTPRVIAYDSSRDSPIGFEWILMDLLPGRSLHDIWSTLTWEVKETVVRKIASYSAQAFRNRSSRIGNLFLSHEYPQNQRHIQCKSSKWSSFQFQEAIEPERTDSSSSNDIITVGTQNPGAATSATSSAQIVSSSVGDDDSILSRLISAAAIDEPINSETAETVIDPYLNTTIVPACESDGPIVSAASLKSIETGTTSGPRTSASSKYPDKDMTSIRKAATCSISSEDDTRSVSNPATSPTSRSPTADATVATSLRSGALYRQIVLGRIVSLDFFQAHRLYLDVPRGPFLNSSQWLHARLQLIKNDCERIITASNDEEDIEEARDDLAFAMKIEKTMLKVISPNVEPETTVLHHADLNAQNILATEDGSFVGLVDWECVSTVPLWKAAQFPAFIETRDRFHEPREENYAHDGEDSEVNPLFHEHVLEYDSTLLRQLFWAEMEKLEPQWIKVHQERRMMRDLDEAISLCGVGWISKRANKWLDAIENGTEPLQLSRRERAFELGHETIDSD